MVSWVRMSLAAGIVLGASVFAGSANAAIGIASGSANLRSGPGIGFAVVGGVYRSERLHVIKCQGEWCFVIHPGRDGWISRKLMYNPQYNRGRGFEYPRRSLGPGRYDGVPPTR